MFSPRSGKLPLHTEIYYGQITAYVNQDNKGYDIFEWIIILSCIILAVFLITALIIRISDFLKQIKYINIEIRRSNGAEKRYWLLQRRQLWLSLFSVKPK